MIKADSVTHALVHTGKDLSLTYSEVKVGKYLLRFHDAGRVSRKRADTVCFKEPTTNLWLDHFTRDDTLLDIGANVGMYTVWAAVRTGCQVRCLEPESLNYAELNKNIYLNKLYDRVRAYCVAASDTSRFGELYLSTFAPSYSHHDAGENRWSGPVTHIAASKEARLPQGCLMLRVDDFLHTVDDVKPTHVKVDVDGLEHKVIAGMEHLLKQPQLKTVLVETDFKVPESKAVFAAMQKAGWKFSYDQVTCFAQRRETKEQWDDRFARGKGGGNIIYFKDEAFYKDFFKRGTR